MVISDCHVALSSGQLSFILLDFSHNYMHNYFSHGSLFLEMLSLHGARALALFYLASYFILSQFSLLDRGGLTFPKFQPRLSDQT